MYVCRVVEVDIRGGSRKSSEGVLGQKQIPKLLISNIMTFFLCIHIGIDIHCLFISCNYTCLPLFYF